MKSASNQLQESIPSGEQGTWYGLTIYQIYPLSFLDTNGDGRGDLPGIIKKRNYLQTVLGVDAILLNPIQPSSGKEGGYDVKNYLAIDPQFGTMEDFDQLVAEFHQAGMRVILDMVINHTSDEHPWFQDVQRCQESPYSEYYIFRPSREGGLPPNNWEANFGGSAWRYIPQRDQWALHSFLPEQVDLNYRNQEVLEAMGKVLVFWLEKGVDAVRLDSLPYTIKHPDLPDGRLNEHYDPLRDHPSTRVLTDDKWFQPGMLDVLKYFTEIASRYPGRLVISESYPPPHLEREWVAKLYAATDLKIHAPLNSSLVNCSWEPQKVLSYLDWFYRQLLPGDIALWSIDNHDTYQRIANRVGDPLVRLAAVLLLTLPGAAVIYYGDEIGMRSHEVPPSLQQDVFRRFNPQTWRSRDPSRLPMPWNDDQHGGFTRLNSLDCRPWLPIAPDYKTVNVRQQLSDPESTLNLYRQLIRIRKEYAELSTGKFEALEANNPHVLAYRLISGEAVSYVVLNFSAKPQIVHAKMDGKLITCTHPNRNLGSRIDLRDFMLRGNEGIIVKVP